MDANKNLRHEAGFTVCGELDPHILVFAYLEFLVKPANLEQLDTSSDNAGSVEVCFEQQSSPELARRMGRQLRSKGIENATFRTDRFAPAGDQRHLDARIDDR